MHTRITLSAAIYQKILTLNQVTIGRLTIGHVVNLASNDVHRLDMVSYSSHNDMYMIGYPCMKYRDILHGPSYVKIYNYYKNSPETRTTSFDWDAIICRAGASII